MPGLVDDDEQRVPLDDEELRGTLVLGPDGQELVYEPYVPFSRREYRAMYARHGAGPKRMQP